MKTIHKRIGQPPERDRPHLALIQGGKDEQTASQKEIQRLLDDGLTARQIAKKTGLPKTTVKAEIHLIFGRRPRPFRIGSPKIW